MENTKQKLLNPTKTIALGFFIVILIGTIFLKLPVATNYDISISDAFFVATSATCVTGLSTVNVIETFTVFGQVIIMLLAQIGGLRIYANGCICAITIWQKDKFKRKDFNKSIYK